MPDTTIESSKYNGNIADVAADLNAPRPIVAGGTGGNSAATARSNLQAEVAAQQVTNYDTHVFESGSFYSLDTSTGGPAASSVFVGTAHVVNANTITLQARNISTTPTSQQKVYVRQKLVGTWGAWTVDVSGTFVAKAGDTMTGPLVMAPSTGTIAASSFTGQLMVKSAVSVATDAAHMTFIRDGIFGADFGIDTDNFLKYGGGSLGANSYRILHEGLADPKVTDPLHVTSPTHARVYLEKGSLGGGGGGGAVCAINSYTGPASVVANTRWSMQVGDSAVEGGGNTGSNFNLIRFNDAGASLGGAFDINRATGLATFYNHLTVTSGGHTYVKVNAAPGLASVVGGFKNSVGRWDLALGNQTAESGGNAGSDFELNRFSDAGAYLGNAMTIVRATGAMQVAGSLGIGAAMSANGYGQFNGQVYSQGASATFGLRNASAVALVDIFPNSDHLYIRNYAAGSADFLITSGGQAILAKGFSGRNGTAGANDGNAHNFRWTGTLLEAWVGSTYVGAVTLTCDYRYKDNVADLSSTWDAVKALRPITYTAKATPQPSPPELLRREGEPEAKPAPTMDTNLEQWGFIAHELQETLTESAATGTKDAPDLIQSPNWMPIVAALTKALQEAMARIEALEAAAAVPVR